MFDNLDTQGMEQSKDTLGGSFIKSSGVYDGIIKYAYGGVSKNGAKTLNLEFQLADGSSYREQLYVTSGTDKGCKPYSEKNGKKTPLQGFSLADSIALIATGKSITQVSPPEDKVINIWNFDEGGERPTSVKMVMDLIGKPVKLGIIEKKEFKREQVNGEWKDTTETKSSNVLDVVFHPTALVTVTEAREGKKTPEFLEKWKAKWEGQVQDKTAGKGNANSGNAGRPQPGGQQTTASKGLFD